MKKALGNLSLVLGVVSIIMYWLFPTYISFESKAPEFIFAGVNMAVMAVALIMFLVYLKISDTFAQFKPYAVPTLCVMVIDLFAVIYRFFISLSYGFVVVLGDGIFRSFGEVLIATGIFYAVSFVFVHRKDKVTTD